LLFFHSVDSTPTIVSGVAYLAFLGTNQLGKTLEDLLINRFGATGLLLILLVAASLCLYHQRNRISVLKERLKLSDDRSQAVEERAKIVHERNALSEERIAAGQELLTLMERARRLIARFPAYLRDDATCCEILLVEDERAVHFFKDAIEAEVPGARVRLASNGAEAWAAVMIRRPSLVITDLIMPAMNGFQLLEKLRESYPQIPVLAISAYVDNPAQIGARIGKLPSRFEFLPKPTTLALILAAIERLMRDQSREQGANSVAI
jgi:CheY-like chemotaxis protein